MKINKEDVFYSLLRLQEYLRQMSEEEFQDFVNRRRSIFTMIVPPKFQLLAEDIEREYTRTITKLEFRIT